MSKKAITAKEETLKALEILMFYHNVQYSVSYVDNPNAFTLPVTLTKERLKALDDLSISEMRIVFKPDFDE